MGYVEKLRSSPRDYPRKSVVSLKRHPLGAYTGPENNCTKTAAIVHSLAAVTGLRQTATKYTATFEDTWTPDGKAWSVRPTMKLLSDGGHRSLTSATGIGSRAGQVGLSPRSQLFVTPRKGLSTGG